MSRALCARGPGRLQPHFEPHNDVAGINALELVLGLRVRSAIPAHLLVAAEQQWALLIRRQG